ncbi:F-box protein [Cardamine amara subsp. amara]|uniref:F-box protein n=1 Tax=Cardamine amara subsp. amara TaxID=228776 RepID=A0ABD1BQL5_CARAN
MTSYEGKLAIVHSKFSESDGLSTCRIDLWILVDAAKHEWSNKVFVLPCWNTELSFQVFCLTDAGEFVLAPATTFRELPFYVLYYDPKKNAVRRVFIEGITELKLSPWDRDLDRRTISIFPGQVQNLMFL